MTKFVKILYIKDWRSYVAEFLGTFAFVLIASGIVLSDTFFGDIGNLGIGLAAGLVYTSLIYVTAHLSGGYLNPAVTLALWLSQRLSGVKTTFYVLAQIVASFAAAYVLLLFFGSGAGELGLGGPILGVNTASQVAIVVEAILTAVLVLCVFGTMVDRSGPVSFGPLVLGFVLAAETIFALPLSGAAFNPARALGPAVVANTFDNLLVWIIGPAAGSLFGLVYEFLFLRKGKK